MPRGKSVLLVSLALAAVAGAGCSDAHRSTVTQAAAVVDPTTTTVAPTTSSSATTAPAPSLPAGPTGPAPVPSPPGGGPLTGFAGPEGLPSRPALVVKIDNGPRA